VAFSAGVIFAAAALLALAFRAHRGLRLDWTASVSSTDFTTGGASPAETIPADDATCAIAGLATAGAIGGAYSATITHSVS
jgi:hypothetical protein